ncbi:MAG: ABC transporter ATP-binding protein [Acidimicrobiales bacterium]
MAGVRVQVSGLRREYPGGKGEPRVALAGVDLEVDPGELVAVMGPSGSGKSTLLHLVGGMDTPSAGTVHVGDWALEKMGTKAKAGYRRQVGFVFQAFHLLSSLGALENVLAPLIPSRPGRAEVERARHLLLEVGLADREGALPSELSGGEQQRVALARALVADPPLVLADEPTGNLDSASGAQVLDLLVDLQARRAATVMIATHDPEVAARCGRVVRLRDGFIHQAPGS